MSCDVIANHNNITVSELPKEADVIKTIPQFQNAHPPKKNLFTALFPRVTYSGFLSLKACKHSFSLEEPPSLRMLLGLMGQNQYHMVFVWAQTDKFAVEFVSPP